MTAKEWKCCLNEKAISFKRRLMRNVKKCCEVKWKNLSIKMTTYLKLKIVLEYYTHFWEIKQFAKMFSVLLKKVVFVQISLSFVLIMQNSWNVKKNLHSKNIIRILVATDGFTEISLEHFKGFEMKKEKKKTSWAQN